VTGKEMTEVSARLNEVVKEAEDYLFALGLGVEASVDVPEYPKEYLAFRNDKQQGGWHLCWERVGPEGVQSTPLTSVNRGRRIRALWNIQRLEEALVDVASMTIFEIRQAIEYAQHYMKSVR